MAKKKKRLRSQITVGHDIEGKPIYKWASGYSKKELSENIEEIKRTYINGVKVQRDICFGEYAKQWYEIYKKPDISASSRVSYSVALNCKLLPAFGDRQMKAITSLQLQAYMNGFEGSGATSITYVHSIIRNVFKQATAQGIIDRDPAVALKKPKATKTTKRALTDDETSAVLSLLNTHPDGLLLAILYFTGLRRGEALGLKWSDIDFSNEFLHVERDVDFVTGKIGECKTKSSVRDVPIPGKLLSMLKDRRGIGFIIKAPTDGRHWNNATYMRHWQKIQADIASVNACIERKGDRSVLTAHYFRHNYASVLYNAGVDVLSAQKYLGHSNASTTMKIYTHLSESAKKRDADKARSAFG